MSESIIAPARIENWPDDQRWAYNGDEYQPLEGVRILGDMSGTLTFRFRPTIRQRIALLFGRDVHVSVMTFHAPLQPLRVDCGEPEFIAERARAVLASRSAQPERKKTFLKRVLEAVQQMGDAKVHAAEVCGYGCNDEQYNTQCRSVAPYAQRLGEGWNHPPCDDASCTIQELHTHAQPPERSIDVERIAEYATHKGACSTWWCSKCLHRVDISSLDLGACRYPEKHAPGQCNCGFDELRKQLAEPEGERASEGAHDWTHPAEDCDVERCDHVTRRTCEQSEKEKLFLRKCIDRLRDRLYKVAPDEARKDWNRIVEGAGVPELSMPGPSAPQPTEPTCKTCGHEAGRHFELDGTTCCYGCREANRRSAPGQDQFHAFEPDPAADLPPTDACAMPMFSREGKPDGSPCGLPRVHEAHVGVMGRGHDFVADSADLPGEEKGLLPCPFCGAEASSYTRQSGNTSFVRCAACGAGGPYSHDGFDTAESRWNCRPSAPPLEQIADMEKRIDACAEEMSIDSDHFSDHFEAILRRHFAPTKEK
jgi:restriction alleviation protein Lar